MVPLNAGTLARPLSPSRLREERRSLEEELLRCEEHVERLNLSEYRRGMARKHPLLMGRIYFPQWMPKETPPFHREMVDGFVNLPRLAMAAPVGSAKTTVITKLGTIWSALFEPWNQESLIVSLSMDLAKTWIDDMARAVAGNEELREDFGELRGVHWGSQELEFVVDEEHHSRNHFIRALGIGGSTRGRRPGRIVLDDPQDEASVKSERQREEFEGWFWGALVNRLDEPYKKLTYIGTCLSPETFLCKLVNIPPEGWVSRSYAILKDDGTSLWNDKYPVSFLNQRRKEIGEEKFQSEFQNNPVRFQAARMFHVEQVTEKVYAKQPRDIVTLTVDPAFRKGGDHWAITVVSQDHNNAWHVLYAKKEQTGTEGWLKDLVEVLGMFPSLYAAGIESGGGGQVSMEYSVHQYMLQRGVRFNPTWIKHPWTKGKKSERIAQLTPIINTGLLTLSPGLEQLYIEIQSYRSGVEKQNDHLLDSLAMHLELQVARTPSVIPAKSVEDIRRDRMRAFRHRIADARRERGAGQSHWDRYLPA